MPRPLKSWLTFLLTIALTAILVLTTAHPTPAADRLYLTYGPFQFTIATQDLAQFAQTGTIPPNLKFLLNRLTPQQQTQFRDLLRLKNEVNPVILSRVTHTITAERLLQSLGELLQTGDRQNSFYALRAALTQAAEDPQGLTLLNILQKSPTDLRLSIPKTLKFVSQLKATIKDTDTFVANLEQTSRAIAQSNPVLPLPNLDQPVPSPITPQTITLPNDRRNRSLTLDLYRPPTSVPTPVILISGGLGGERHHFQELAQNLASQGFTAITLDHPGSNAQHQRDFFKGQYPENFDSQDFLDRPRDITFVLDQLTQLNPTQFNNQLNLQQVGMFGYSLGGTAALALAGAKINFTQLQKDCQSPIPLKNLLNIALLYQCRALELPQQNYALKDDRIKAIFLFIPSSKHIYNTDGIQSIKIPVFWQATNQDIITPLLLEQVPMFAALPSTHKYLAVSQGLPHTRVILRLLDRVTGTNRAALSDELFRVTQNYLKTFNTAFFKTYLNQDQTYSSYLTAAYAQTYAQKPYDLSLVQSLPNLNQ